MKKTVAATAFMLLFAALMLLGVVHGGTSVAASASEMKPVLNDLTVQAALGGGGKLSPAFSMVKTDYSIRVHSDIASIDITPTAFSKLKSLTINNVAVKSGAPYSASLAVGSNKIDITVTGVNGAARTYTINATREDIQPVVNKFLKLTYTDPATGASMPYRLYVPENYDASKAYPIVLFLHGSGERGDDNEKQLMANQGATIWAKPEEQAKHPCFVLAPEAHNNVDGGFGLTRGNGDNKTVYLGRMFQFSDDLKLAVKVLDEVEKNYNIDKSREYSTGLSQGGIGTWNLNEAYPGRFAAMVPVSAAGNPTEAYKLVNKPIWEFHAAADPVIPVKYSQQAISTLRLNGGNPIYTEYAANANIKPMAHFAWVPAYDNSAMRDWLFNQKLDDVSQLSDIGVQATIGVSAALTPAFSPNKTEYRINVQSDISSINLTPAASSILESLTINGKAAKLDAAYSAALVVGENKIEFAVTSKTGVSKIYTVTVVRENIQPIVDKFLKLSFKDPVTGAVMPYRLYVPDNYDATKAYPIVLFLHGSGERGDDNEKQLTANQGATIWAKPEEQAKHPCFVLAPQARNEVDGGFGLTRGNGDNKTVYLGRLFQFSDDLKMAVKVLDSVEKSYNIDKSKEYSTGLSQGGIGTWNLNEAYPDRFAAMVAVSAAGDPAQASKLANKPMWEFHAADDPVIPVKYSQDAIAAVKAAGGTPIYTEYKTGAYIAPMAHFAWVPAYATAEMRDWLFKQIKK